MIVIVFAAGGTCCIVGCTSVSCKCAAPMSDIDQLVQASRLYYELGETQNAIAERLGVTRPQVAAS